MKVASNKLVNPYPEFTIGFGKGVNWNGEVSKLSEIFVLSTKLFFFS